MLCQHDLPTRRLLWAGAVLLLVAVHRCCVRMRSPMPAQASASAEVPGVSGVGMRRLVVSEVVVSSAAWQLLSPDEQAQAAASGLVRVASRSAVSGGFVVGVGATADDASRRDAVDVYFHVGPIRHLQGKVGVSVPLIEQWAVGVLNVIRWAAMTGSVAQPVASHEDVAMHARHAAAQYRRDSHVETMRSVASGVADELARNFPKIQAVLGTGFPWYCIDASGDRGADGVPESIRFYTETQAAFFERKLLPREVAFELDSHRRWSEDELARLGVELGQTEFNAYEYERWGVSPPRRPNGLQTLRQSVKANLVDLGDRDWPCHLCTALHNSARFPQRWERDFMKSCLECNQTPFIPRAVGVLGSDVDVVAIAEDGVDPGELAAEIAGWIDDHPRYFRHDTDWVTQLGAPHGPLDVFVVRRSDFLAAASSIATASAWAGVTVRAAVTWLPVTALDYEVGKYFVLCMEPLLEVDSSDAFTTALSAHRRDFANRVSAEELFEFYGSDSAYLQQLVTNHSTRQFLRGRLDDWMDR